VDINVKAGRALYPLKVTHPWQAGGILSAKAWLRKLTSQPNNITEGSCPNVVIMCVARRKDFMKPSPRPARTPLRLSDSLHRQLEMYALAASAGGVALLALGPLSEAKIIYTKTHQVIGANGIYPLDLNHDGAIDFLIKRKSSGTEVSWFDSLGAKEAFGNAIEGGNNLVDALYKGASIGPRQRFVSNTYASGEGMFRGGCSGDQGCGSTGQWKNVNRRYLGLKFQIDGKTHYGWARLNVSGFTGTLTGYAYETVANKRIRAGQTSGNPADTIIKSGSAEAVVSDSAAPAVSFRPNSPRSSLLGRLALGFRQTSPRRLP
jgi:hypothetical protein